MKKTLNGMFIAISVVALVGCFDSGGDAAALTEQLSDLDGKLTLAERERDRAAVGQKEAEENLSALEAELQTLKQQMKDFEDRATEAEAKAEQLEEDFDTYRETYRASIRKRAPGMELGELVYAGRNYTDVVIREADDIGLSVRHSSGIGRFSYTGLPVEIRRRFAYSAEAAELAAAAERGPGEPVAEIAGSAPSAPRVVVPAGRDRPQEATPYVDEQLEREKQLKIARLEAGISRSEARISAIEAEISQRKSDQVSAEIRGRSSSASSRITVLRGEKANLEAQIAEARTQLRLLR